MDSLNGSKSIVKCGGDFVVAAPAFYEKNLPSYVCSSPAVGSGMDSSGANDPRAEPQSGQYDCEGCENRDKSMSRQGFSRRHLQGVKPKS